MERNQYEMCRVFSGDVVLYDGNGKDVALVRAEADGGSESIAALFAAAPRLIESLQALVNTLEGAWSERQITAPRYVQCQLGTEVKRAKEAIRQAISSLGLTR